MARTTTIRAGEVRNEALVITARGRLVVERTAALRLSAGVAVSLDADTQIVNHGTIASSGPVIRATGIASILNAKGGRIASTGRVAIESTADHLRLINQGDIAGTIVASGTIQLHNSGIIGATWNGGVRANGGEIVNVVGGGISGGGVSGGSVTILMDDGHGGGAQESSRIINYGGLLGNGAPVIRLVGDQDDVVNNRGSIDVTGHAFAIDTGGGNDRVVNYVVIWGGVALGDGDDVFLNKGALTGVIDGGAGDDRIEAGETMSQVIIGGLGRDVLTGNGGKDIFTYRTIAESVADLSRADRITDFDKAEGDVIDLSQIDADATLVGNQAFTFIGNAAFSGTAGELRIEQRAKFTAVFADVDGDGVADFAIRLDGHYQPEDMQFLL